ncbi:hypothetical protein GCM10027072_28310 [Streptomyces bullii]
MTHLGVLRWRSPDGPARLGARGSPAHVAKADKPLVPPLPSTPSGGTFPPYNTAPCTALRGLCRGRLWLEKRDVEETAPQVDPDRVRREGA